MLALYSYTRDATPCLGHRTVCAHACARGGSDGGQSRLSSALVLPACTSTSMSFL